ncbi:MAG: c-type cytochrome [Ignavibacteriae bacterium]|nr:c-type cytochrome [Ignavibacteriota bacterium]
MRRTKYLVLIAAFALSLLTTGCGENTEEIGIGPVKSVTLGPVDKNLADKGKEIFDAKCIACHKFDYKLVGPPLKDVTKRRKPEWIMNMILNPEQMTKENTAAKQLFGQYLTQMTFQNVTQDDARAVLEYFRMLDN